MEMDKELSYYGKVAKLMDDYAVKGILSQGELADLILGTSLDFLSDYVEPQWCEVHSKISGPCSCKSLVS